MTSRRVTKANTLFNKINELLNNLKGTIFEDQNDLLNAIRRIHVTFVKFSILTDKVVDNSSSPVRTNTLTRRKTLLEKTLRQTVQDLGFDYDTDILFADSLPEASDADSGDEDSGENSGDGNNSDAPNEEINLDNMATFDMKLAMTSIEKFTGTSETLLDFIGTVKCFNRMLNAAGQVLFLDFLINFKMTSKVKNRLSTQTFNSLDTLCTELTNRFADKTTEEEKMNQLESARQKQGVRDFANKIENLAADLLRLKMVGQTEEARAVINSGVQKLAVRHFVKGLKRTEVKQALIYKQPADLTEAIKFALEADARFFDSNQEVTVNHYNARYSNDDNNNRPVNRSDNRNNNNNRYNNNFQRNGRSDYNNFNNGNRNFGQDYRNRGNFRNYQSGQSFHNDIQNGHVSQDNRHQQNRNYGRNSSFGLNSGNRNNNYQSNQDGRNNQFQGRRQNRQFSNSGYQNNQTGTYYGRRNVNHFQQQPVGNDNDDDEYFGDNDQGNENSPLQAGGSRLGDVRE